MQFDNVKQVARVTPDGSGELYLDRQKFSLVNAKSYANGDLFQVAVVPAGTILVPHLTRISVPVLDSNGTPTGTYDIGTVATPDALATGEDASKANVLQVGTLPDVAIGSTTEDTPIYITLTAALATQAATGEVVTDLVVRAIDPEIDPV